MLYMHNRPDWAKDQIRSHTEIHLSFKDRIKLLLGWRLTLNLKTECEVPPGRLQAESEVIVWRPSKREVCGMAEIGESA